MRRRNRALILALFLLLASLSAWVYQVRAGLIITHMRNPFSWGLYIATFAFFVGIAAGGLIVSSAVYLFSLEALKPFTRIASLSAFASILAAAVIILPDLGRVDRIYFLLLHPNFRSPLIWDVIVVSSYIVLTFLSVYFQLLPDWKREGRGFLNHWTRKLSQEEVKKISTTWSKRIAFVGLPVAILIHTITALIFATQVSREWWYTTILPADFIAVAVSSGAALCLLIALLGIGEEGFPHYAAAFTILSRIAAGSLLVHLFLVATDLVIHWWWGNPEELELLSLLFRRYGALYGLEVVLTVFSMVYFLTSRGISSPRALLGGCLILLAGVFIHRLNLLFPAFNHFPLALTLPGTESELWSYPVAVGQFQPGNPIFVSTWPYVPSAWEIIIDLLPFALALITCSWMISSYNLLPTTWEGKTRTIPFSTTQSLNL
ncbi:prokaryotic molybdopterin-containing oxidoreductase family, membrane subunit [Thermanaeromonas toyohensis ToBE]|uniref:Prokaryotic molybdopterin-containing oxidoreductase family, membrane subunit n=1 Tax=Thermanaeromonas toyohensis ToBE TaxID=698762 RepID=A0A1W1VXS3_9FIRM|nr:NrfD/PsrC family molybdoenzyme membrane anchor subunit [Thermanaeromonas toyohensis]SMB98050.1 prokaryotic molybdopterin-containing oxidoreductase family, membrane subunit [Thermanaeromonas toyohensis ToBE]